MIQLFFAAKWILISEVTFESGEFQLFSSRDIFVKVPSPSSQTGHYKKALQRNLHRSVSRKIMPLVPGRWNEKRMMRNVWQCLLCSYSRAGSNNTDMRIKSSPHCHPHPLSSAPQRFPPHKGSNYFRIKQRLLSRKLKATKEDSQAQPIWYQIC